MTAAPGVAFTRALCAVRRVADLLRDYVAAPEEARAWEWEKAKDTDWLKARIHDAGYPCTEVTHAFANLYGGAAKLVQVSCGNGEHQYAISEESVKRVGVKDNKHGEKKGEEERASSSR